LQKPLQLGGFSLAVRGWDYDRENFGFSRTAITQRQAPKPTKRGKCFSLLDFPTLFQHALRSLAMFQQLRLVPQTPPLRGALISGSNRLGKRLSLFLTVHSTSF
jgi:hypothetical protein